MSRWGGLSLVVLLGCRAGNSSAPVDGPAGEPAADVAAPVSTAPTGAALSINGAYPLLRTLGHALPAADGVLNLPSGVAVDSQSGDVYVSDTVFRRIQRFTADGKHLKTWETLASMGLTVDPKDGTVLLTLPGKGKVIRYSKDGEQLAEIGGEMSYPADVTVSPLDGTIAVLNKDGDMDLFTREGVHLRTWYAGVEKPKNTSKLRPVHRNFGVAFALDGRSIYVSNSGFARVSQFDLEGGLIRRWGKNRSSEPGLMRWPRGMAVDGKGNVYIADTDNERLQAFTGDGTLIRWFRGPHDLELGTFHPRAVAVNQTTGDVYAAASYSHRIDHFDPEGNFKSSIGIPHTDPMAFNEPRGIAVSPQTGQIYVTDKRDHLIRRYAADGTFEKGFRLSPGDVTGLDVSWAIQAYFQFPAPIEVAPDGTLWMLRQGFHYPDDPGPGHYLRQYTADGEFLRAVEHEALAGYMSGIDVHDQTGDIWISAEKTGSLVHLSADGSVVGVYTDPASPLKEPAGVSIDEARGRVVVLDAGTNLVRIFDTSGQPIQSFGGEGKAAGQLRLMAANGVEVDDCGRIYVPDHDNRRVQVFSAEGEVLDLFPTSAERPPPEPWDIQVVGETVYVLTDDGVKIFQGPSGCPG